jgi:hypothetical protein
MQRASGLRESVGAREMPSLTDFLQTAIRYIRALQPP